MNILTVGINYWPERTGIAVFNTRRCEYLASRGHRVTACTAFPYYPEWKTAEAYRGRLVSTEEHNGVTIQRNYAYIPSRITSVRRLLHEASFIATSTLRMLAGQRPDLILCVSPPLGLGVTAMMLGRWWKVPYVFHVEDLQPDAAVDLGMLTKGRLTNALYAVEHMAYRNAALISTITESMAARIISKGFSPDKVALFGHGTSAELFEIPIEGGGAAFRQMFGLEGKFLITHCGNMGVKQGLSVVLEAAARARHLPELVFLLVGDGAARPGLEAEAKERGLENVRFLPLQPNEVFMDFLAASDIALITQKRSVADIVFPSKTETLLAAGRAAIASLNSSSEVARTLEEAGGEVVAAEDPDALLTAVLRLKDDPDRRRAMGESGRTYARWRWAGSAMLTAMEARLTQVVAATSGSSSSIVETSDEGVARMAREIEVK